jgi:hypothetical protein
MGDNPAHRADDGGEKAVPENIPRKTLAPGAKPRFETIATIMRALNVGFSVESRLPVRAKKARRLTVT